jgi:hypothetical protein
MFLDKTRLEAQMQWIGVADRLPDDGIDVMVALGDGCVWVGCLDPDGEGGEWVDPCNFPIDVTHWCEFPEHPGEKQAEACTPAKITTDGAA